MIESHDRYYCDECAPTKKQDPDRKLILELEVDEPIHCEVCNVFIAEQIPTDKCIEWVSGFLKRFNEDPIRWQSQYVRAYLDAWEDKLEDCENEIIKFEAWYASR